MGGNVFKGKTTSIKKENIKPTMDKYFEDLKSVFPQKKNIFNLENMKPIGSTLKKSISGDIDLAIDTSCISNKSFSEFSLKQWGLESGKVHKQFLIYRKRARTSTDSELIIKAILKGITEIINDSDTDLYCEESKVGIGGIFTLYPQYNSEGKKLNSGVQIDWMVGNKDWLKFSYYSESYKENIKGLHRTQLLLSMFNNIGLSFSHIKGISNLNTKEILATTPKEAIEILEKEYKIELNESYNNYFKLMELIQTLPEKDDIYDIYLKILDKTRCDIPYNLQEYWLNNKKRLELTGKFLPQTSILYKNKGNLCQE